ncbi:uncharacterized protein LAESUDRAFT_763634 [Laetiporus sulphureus 93-53]|uniref:Uncharacterized protein n=1 Tax=Laetiporus sulphureus 93-53 TaxID=1314785 RepID=A0A165BR29_9APHY|nr:uncharacterized protein LAESUDRAFT_763634 [Laetiporus sulphureus 93-53]KZT01499.1 hypothetical protein LAESUDRAFT_763634 [Laetiporus sulphureus 93-53]
MSGDSHTPYDAQTSSTVPPTSEKADSPHKSAVRGSTRRTRPSKPSGSPTRIAIYAHCPSLASPVIQSSGSSSPLVAYARREFSPPSAPTQQRSPHSAVRGFTGTTQPSKPSGSPTRIAIYANCPSLASPVVQSSGSSSPLVASPVAHL